MLFDLRGRGRRRTIKVIYASLAILMGGGLVFFGIGGDVQGGLFDVFGETPAADTGEERFLEREQAALVKIKANPANAAAWADLARTRIQISTLGDRYDQNTGEYNAEGKAKLREAAAAWEKYIELDPPVTEAGARVASLMVQAYISLEDLTKAARAQEIIAEVRDTKGAYATLAQLSYAAGQTRKGDLAAKKAIEKEEPDLREALKGQLEAAKNQGIVNQVQSQDEG